MRSRTRFAPYTMNHISKVTCSPGGGPPFAEAGSYDGIMWGLLAGEGL